MSDKQYDYDVTYAIDRDGNEETLQMKEIPYDVYKAAKGNFLEHPDKAIRIILSCADPEGKAKALEQLDKQNTVAILSLESALAELITPIAGQLKKKSKSTQ
jgi:hypothetical protein